MVSNLEQFFNSDAFFLLTSFFYSLYQEIRFGETAGTFVGIHTGIQNTQIWHSYGRKHLN